MCLKTEEEEEGRDVVSQGYDETHIVRIDKSVHAVMAFQTWIAEVHIVRQS